MHTLAKSENLDEMRHHAAFHQDLHCALSDKNDDRSSGKEI